MTKEKSKTAAMTEAHSNDKAIATLAGFASAPDLGQPNNKVLEKFASDGLIRRMSIGSRTFYEIESAKKVLDGMYLVPEGYVSAMHLEQQLDVASARPLRSACLAGKIKGARKIAVENKKPQWFCDERAGRAFLSKVIVAKAPARAEPKPVAAEKSAPALHQGDHEDVLALVRSMINAQNKRADEQNQRAVDQHKCVLALVGETRMMVGSINDALGPIKPRVPVEAAVVIPELGRDRE